MKSLLKVVVVGSAIALGTAALPANSYAGDRDWATVGKVLTGVAAVGILAAIIDDANHQHAVVHGGYDAPPQCEPPRRWIPGYWDTVVDPPQYGWVRYGCCFEYAIVRPGCTHRVWVPERYEVRKTRVWVPARGEVGRYAYNR